MNRLIINLSVLLCAAAVFSGCEQDSDRFKEQTVAAEEIEQAYQEIKLTADSILLSGNPVAGFEQIKSSLEEMEEVETVEVREDGLFVKMKNDKVVMWLQPAKVPTEAVGALSAVLSKAKADRSPVKVNKSVCLLNQQSYESDQTLKTLSAVCINKLHERFSSSGWNVRTVENTGVNLAFIRDSLEKYDAVYYIAHGCEFDNKVWICTNEKVMEEEQAYCAVMNLVDKNRGTVDETYAFNADFINEYYRCSLPAGSIVYMVACQSTGSRGKANSSMANAFVNHGATVYLGWDETNYSGQEAGLFLYDQLLSGKTLSEAYASLESFPANVRSVYQQDYFGFVYGVPDLENLAEDKSGWGKCQYTATLRTYPSIVGDFRLVEPAEDNGTVVLGNTVWMAKNLDVTTFRNGDVIAEAKSKAEWQTCIDNNIPAYCTCNFDSNTRDTYGLYYNCYAVLGSRELCPAGWRLPGNTDVYALYSGFNDDIFPLAYGYYYDYYQGWQYLGHNAYWWYYDTEYDYGVPLSLCGINNCKTCYRPTSVTNTYLTAGGHTQVGAGANVRCVKE
ncbi:MAG: fibrobacter succinogenes major paralogous domain-containing protein [Prevotella sp.]|nr:fibrobacter succinogenes major paralogous domain-containing protein [Prevotella sp.]